MGVITLLLAMTEGVKINAFKTRVEPWEKHLWAHCTPRRVLRR